MNQDRRFLLKFASVPSHEERLTRFFSHYDLRIFLTQTAYIDLGGGSLSCADRLTMLSPPHGFAGCLATVGRWCDFALTSEVMRRAEHTHELPVNISLSCLRPFVDPSIDMGMREAPAISVGNGVVISSGARVLPGASLGDGCVVGANAVVRFRVEPYSIVAGVPAREVGKRSPGVPWWDFAVDYLLANYSRLQEVAATEGPHEWRAERPRFVLTASSAGYAVVGFTDGEVVRPLPAAPEAVQSYVAEAFKPDMREAYWVPDCWAT